MESKSMVVTLSGSMKFYKSMLKVAEEMSSRGIIVLSPFLDPRGEAGLTDDAKAMHNKVHNEKILMADKLFVVNVGGYIGNATQREIDFAIENDKPVEYLVDPDEAPKGHMFPVIAMSGSMRFFDRMLQVADELNHQGVVVLMPIMDHRNTEVVERYRARLIAMQHERIEMADTLYVINPDGYIGEHTQDDIDYATSLGKNIRYLEAAKGPHIVTLIGSGKFKETFNKVESMLTLKGYLVFTPSIFTVMQTQEVSDREHRVMDEVHRKKMRMSDEVLVINPGGYIGADTRDEINWATKHGINVKYYNDMNKLTGGNEDAKN